MKTRSAFVSNSSSSSFIIENSNQIEVAKTMHQYMVEELEEFYGADDEYTIDRRNDWSSLLEVCKKPDVISGENGIMFASTNYTTTIKQIKDRVFVSTCNNHTWDDCWLQHMIVKSELMDPNMWAKMSDILRNSYFYGAGGDDVLLDGQMYFDPEDETEFRCPKCGINKHFWYCDKDGNPYCTLHFIRMTKVEHNDRYSFDSNSSSASFIVSGIKLNDLVESIYDQYIDEVYNWGLNEEQRDQLIDDLRDQAISTLELCELPDVQNGKRGITFLTLDYDTYILVHEDKIYISTCDNIHWIKGLPNSVNIEYIGRGKDSGKEDECDLVMKSFYFYSSSGDKKPISYRIDNIAVNSGDFYTCPKCNDGRRVYWAYEGEDGHYYCVEDYTRLIKIE